METSQTIGKISEALSKAQGQMKNAAFDASNPHFKSKYASLASIMDSCRAALSANGIAILQGTSVDSDSNRVHVTTLLAHVSGEFIKETLSIKPARDDAQSIGSAITYARRYGLSALVGIIGDEDDDGNAAVTSPNTKPVLTTVKKTVQEPRSPEPKAQESKPEVPASKPQNGNGRVAKIRQIFTLSAQLGHTPDEMKTIIGDIIGLDRPLKESSEIPTDKLDIIISTFQKNLEVKSEPRKEAA